MKNDQFITWWLALVMEPVNNASRHGKTLNKVNSSLNAFRGSSGWTIYNVTIYDSCHIWWEERLFGVWCLSASKHSIACSRTNVPSRVWTCHPIIQRMPQCVWIDVRLAHDRHAGTAWITISTFAIESLEIQNVYFYVKKATKFKKQYTTNFDNFIP